MNLVNGHIVISRQLAEAFFDDGPQVNWVYYANNGTLFIASKSDELFRNIHKTSTSVLKLKNAEGDRSISMQELLIDHVDIQSEDRELDFVADEKMKILLIKLK